MKLGVFTVSTPDYDLPLAMQKLAELGYEGLELRVCEDRGDRSKPGFWSGNRTSITAGEIIARAAELRALANRWGLKIPSLGAYVDAADPAAVEEHCQAAAALGARSVRINVGPYDPRHGPYHQQAAAARARYAVVANIAARHSVRALLETHMGQLAPSVATAMHILQGLNPDHVGIIWDPGNQVYEGLEVYSMALELAGRYLAEVHVKNARYVAGEQANGRITWRAVSCPLREGIVDWPAVVAALKAVGYQGWLFFEDFSTDHPLEERLRDNLVWFRELLG